MGVVLPISKHPIQSDCCCIFVLVFSQLLARRSFRRSRRSCSNCVCVRVLGPPVRSSPVCHQRSGTALFMWVDARGSAACIPYRMRGGGEVLAAVMHWHRSAPGRDDATAALLQMVRFPLLSMASLQALRSREGLTGPMRSRVHSRQIWL